MLNKYAFFDVDGVLSAPRFMNDNNEFVIGFDKEGWKNYLDTHGKDAYKYCDSIPKLDKYINTLINEGCKLYVLSAISYENEKDAKIQYLNEKYPGIFKEYFFVYSSLDKVKFIEEFSRKNNIDIQQCMLIEDTFDILLDAHNHNIISIHVSNILSNTISK